MAALLARVLADGGRARAPVWLCVPDAETGREIDIALPQDYPVTPKVRSALRAASGVLLVEDL